MGLTKNRLHQADLAKWRGMGAVRARTDRLFDFDQAESARGDVDLR
jgi:hypothetical protein